MAINNGRYVVTGGYIDPNGNIVEEKQFVPNATTPTTPTTPTVTTSTPAFSNAEAYALQSQGYANQGDDAMARAYGNIANNLGRYSTFANNSLNTADALLNYIRGNEQNLQGAAGTLYNQLVGDIQNTRNYINDQFGPDGALTKEVNQYYDDLGNYLATDAGRQAAQIAAQGVHSGASLGAIRAQQNEAYNESFQRYIQAKEQQINAKQQIASNLINYMSTLRKEYGDTTNDYIINLYKRANDLYNSVAQSTADDIDQFNAALATPSSSGGTSASDALLSQLFGLNSSSTEGGGNTVVTDPAGNASQGNNKAYETGAAPQNGNKRRDLASQILPNNAADYVTLVSNPMLYPAEKVISNLISNKKQ